MDTEVIMAQMSMSIIPITPGTKLYEPFSVALTRKKGESLVVNNNIEITVLEIRGDQVKIGISAPKEVPIYRKEVYLQIQNENKAALNIDAIASLKDLL
jgi:carbon storage regulator